LAVWINPKTLLFMIRRTFWLLFATLLLTSVSLFAQMPGDSLAINVERVWAYTNPDDLTTRLGPFHYTSKQMVFLEAPESHSRYYRVITPVGDTAYSLKKNLLWKPDLDVERVRQEIREGSGDHAPGFLQLVISVLIDWSKWYTWVGMFLWVLLLFLFWYKFPLFDSLINRMRNAPHGSTGKRWPLTLAALTGILVGITAAIAARESEWFFSEGIRIIAWYPSFWDYLWWLICITFFVAIVLMVIESIRQFGWVFGIIRSILLFVIMNLYVFTGLVTGWIIALLAFLYLIFKILGSRYRRTPRVIKYRGQKYIRK
jgi:hypothetical protein